MLRHFREKKKNFCKERDQAIFSEQPVYIELLCRKTIQKDLLMVALYHEELEKEVRE